MKNTNLKMYHVMSVKQTLREDLAEHAISSAVGRPIGHDRIFLQCQCDLSH